MATGRSVGRAEVRELALQSSKWARHHDVKSGGADGVPAYHRRGQPAVARPGKWGSMR